MYNFILETVFANINKSLFHKDIPVGTPKWVRVMCLSIDRHIWSLKYPMNTFLFRTDTYDPPFFFESPVPYDLLFWKSST